MPLPVCPQHIFVNVFPSAAAGCCQSLITYAQNAIAQLLQMPLTHVSLGHMLNCCRKHVVLEEAEEEPCFGAG